MTFDCFGDGIPLVVRQLHTSSATANLYPTFPPDGRRIAFYGNATGPFEIYAINANGTHLKRLTDAAGAAVRQ